MARIETEESEADVLFSQAMKSSSDEPELLRSFASYVSTIKHDKQAARRHLEAADFWEERRQRLHRKKFCPFVFALVLALAIGCSTTTKNPSEPSSGAAGTRRMLPAMPPLFPRTDHAPIRHGRWVCVCPALPSIHPHFLLGAFKVSGHKEQKQTHTARAEHQKYDGEGIPTRGNQYVHEDEEQEQEQEQLLHIPSVASSGPRMVHTPSPVFPEETPPDVGGWNSAVAGAPIVLSHNRAPSSLAWEEQHLQQPQQHPRVAHHEVKQLTSIIEFVMPRCFSSPP